jgi:uncharacterized membrane protein
MRHPIHPLLVHFPIACWSLATLDDLLGLLVSHDFSRIVGFLLLIGCVSAIPAMAAGLSESLKLRDVDLLVKVAGRHMYFAASSWCCYSLSLYLHWDNGTFMVPDEWIIVTSMLGFICLIFTGWYGAGLVYRHGVGVDEISLSSTPE